MKRPPKSPNRWRLRARAKGNHGTTEFHFSGPLSECLAALDQAVNPATNEQGFLRHATVSIRPEGIE